MLRKAFDLVVADLQVNRSALLLEMVEEKVKTHRGGIFFDMVATEMSQSSEESEEKES